MFGDTYVALWRDRSVAVKRIAVALHYTQLQGDARDWMYQEAEYLRWVGRRVGCWVGRWFGWWVERRFGWWVVLGGELGAGLGAGLDAGLPGCGWDSWVGLGLKQGVRGPVGTRPSWLYYKAACPRWGGRRFGRALKSVGRASTQQRNGCW